MKILFLTSRLPYPPYRGDKLKMWNLMKQLSKRHKIVLVTFIASDRELKSVEPLLSICKEVHLVRLPPWKSILNCALALWSSTPFQVAYYSSSKMRQKLGEVIERWEPDIIHTHLIRMVQYTNSLSSRFRVLDLTDAVSLYLMRFLEIQKNTIMSMMIRAELKRILLYEHVLEVFNIVLVCSAADREALQSSAPSANIRLLQNGIDLEAFSPRNSLRQDSRRIIFTGNMSYFPNIDGAKFFVKEIFPMIRRELPDARLWIVGQSPPRTVRSLASENVVVTGFVKDIAAEYLKSAVAISPIRFGAGTLNKVLEPLALGIPVVTTTIGVQGLDFKRNSSLCVADDPLNFAAEVVRILKDPLRGKLSRQTTMRLVRNQFGWDRVARNLESLYKNGAGERIVDGKKTVRAKILKST